MIILISLAGTIFNPGFVYNARASAGSRCTPMGFTDFPSFHYWADLPFVINKRIFEEEVCYFKLYAVYCPDSLI